MPTTTLRLPDELRTRIAKLAAKSGRTLHSVMLEAITQKVEEEEVRASFSSEADARFAETIASGGGIPWHEMRTYLKRQAAGKKTPATTPRLRRK
jgi:predicted transcriptional regulator